MTITALALLALLASGSIQAPPAPRVTVPTSAGPPFRFVVLGHLRGDNSGELSPKLAEVLDEVRRVRPDCVVLTGDLIWGDYHTWPPDSAKVVEQWRQLDSALATLGVPIYRIPGNHDLHDPITRDIWRQRYGPLPQRIDVRGHRFLMLRSAWIRPTGDSDRMTRGMNLDGEQVEFLRRELATVPQRGRTFVFLHHLLWWEADTAAWWREIHPLLAASGTSAVFSGDYGPMKFSTMNRDGVRYFQTSIEFPVPVVMQRNRLASRLLSSQFDNFLVVNVDGDDVSVDVHTVAAVSSGQFTPERWREINEVPPDRPQQSAWRKAWEMVDSPKRLLAAGVVTMVIFAAGWLAGRRRRSG